MPWFFSDLDVLALNIRLKNRNLGLIYHGGAVKFGPRGSVDYISEKLKAGSTCIDSVWSILYEIYDVELSTSNFLDYASMSKEPDESYRNYYNRLVGFVRHHLPQKEEHAEGISCPEGGEELTIALLDAIAIHWLISLDRELLYIVKTEFAL